MWAELWAGPCSKSTQQSRRRRPAVSGHVTSLRRRLPEARRHVGTAAAPQPDAIGVSRGQTGPADESLVIPPSFFHPAWKHLDSPAAVAVATAAAQRDSDDAAAEGHKQGVVVLVQLQSHHPAVLLTLDVTPEGGRGLQSACGGGRVCRRPYLDGS